MKGVVWLAWRQQRLMILVTAAVLAVCAGWVVYRRSEMVSLIDATGWVPCPGWNGGCESLDTFRIMDGNTTGIRALGTLGLALPALIGVFWGAPLIGRELETGTFKLALTQGVGPRRWFAARFGLAALCALLASAVVAALVAWWWAPIANTLDGPYWHDPSIYNATGPAAPACALFALTVGTLAGLLVRRVVAGDGRGLRGHRHRHGVRDLLPAQLDRSRDPDHPRHDAQAARRQRLVHRGVRLPDARRARALHLERLPDLGEELRRCMAEHDFVARYHKVYPSSDFWTFQWIDTALYAGAAALLLAFAFAVLRRRTA